MTSGVVFVFVCTGVAVSGAKSFGCGAAFFTRWSTGAERGDASGVTSGLLYEPI